jgi:monoamine oxidase
MRRGRTGLSEATETVIVGAGAAGLAAASELTSANHDVVVLEARDRLGGRILTHEEANAPVPIELGAEFVHGESRVIMSWLERANQVAVGMAGDRWTVHRGKLRPAGERLPELKRRFDKIAPPRRDISFAEFLRRHSRSLPPAVRELACMLVEGFDAADPTRISALEVLQEWSGNTAADAPTFRPSRGYGALIQSMRQSLKPDHAKLRLNTVVREIRWRKGRVSVVAQRHGEPVCIEARRAIITLPLGVLQLPAASPDSVRFTPELRSKGTPLMRLASGPAIRVVMSFARPFWAEMDDGRYREASFFFAPRASFPTFWTSLPMRTSILVAWSAGPNAARLAGKSRDEIIAIVLDSMRGLFGRGLNYPSLLESIAWHDWQRDPFARGAYSYVMTNGAAARRGLARPVDDTLHFAGEACDTKDESATVGGALQSGERAARQILESAAGRQQRRSSRSR